MIDDRIPTAATSLLPTPVEYDEIEPDDNTRGDLLVNNLDVVKNVAVKLQVKAGEAMLSVGELLALTEGQVLRLDSPLDAPLQILLDGRCVATGELMAMGDHFAVRIVDTVQRG